MRKKSELHPQSLDSQSSGSNVLPYKIHDQLFVNESSTLEQQQHSRVLGFQIPKCQAIKHHLRRGIPQHP